MDLGTLCDALVGSAYAGVHGTTEKLLMSNENIAKYKTKDRLIFFNREDSCLIEDRDIMTRVFDSKSS